MGAAGLVPGHTCAVLPVRLLRCCQVQGQGWHVSIHHGCADCAVETKLLWNIHPGTDTQYTVDSSSKAAVFFARSQACSKQLNF